MPGRDELVQENINRANSSNGGGTTVSSTTTTDSSQSTVGTAPILSPHRTLMGANLDIVEALNLMVFSNATPLGDGGLRNSTAVIRRWSRQGTADVGTIPQSSITSIPFPTTTNPQTVPISYSTKTPPLSSAQTPYNAVIFPGKTPVTTTQAFSPVPQGGSVGVTLAGSGTIPTTTEPPPLSEQSVVVQQSVNTPGSAAQAASTSGAPGAVKSANPSGIVYSGVFANQGGKGIQSKVGSLTPGQWQFLFNPSELELVVGPEFKASEAWGVSDKANSGQPLHWTHNKNAQLKFNSVLLNGYVFGRQVEELEQGLIDLFMARDGEGQYGPDVLEFVWGRRVFGPCVIKDISIKEKMWDEGMVVNAELSFTLEQIPEWTINDGYVDVARPGRLPLIYDSTELQAPAESSGQSGTSTPGETDKENQKARTPQTPPSAADSSLCKWAVERSREFQALFNRVNNPLLSASFGNFEGQVSQFLNYKKQLYSGSSEVGAFVDKQIAPTSSGCTKNNYANTVNELKVRGGGFSINGLLISPEQQTIQFIRECSKVTKGAIDKWIATSPKCKSSGSSTLPKPSKAQIDQCSKYTGKCSTPGAVYGTAGQCPFVNSGKGVRCSGGVWVPI